MRKAWCAAVLLVLAGCRTGGSGRPPEASRPPEAVRPDEGPAPLPVKKASEEVVVAAWSEPKQLPTGGGQAQILVRAQKRGGSPFPGVEVRIQASGGALFSQGRVLTTDAGGRTRDRLTTRKPAVITVNAGGTVYRFRVLLHVPEAAASTPD